uniref:Uncharacterized protein n=1 Tax=Cacopsylla melanoneura TaxID=428564 RepID=A0A8D8R5I5_9HEMI
MQSASFYHEVFFSSSFFLLFFSCLSSSLPSSFLDYVINFLFIPFSPSLLFCKNVQYNNIILYILYIMTSFIRLPTLLVQTTIYLYTLQKCLNVKVTVHMSVESRV